MLDWTIMPAACCKQHQYYCHMYGYNESPDIPIHAVQLCDADVWSTVLYLFCVSVAIHFNIEDFYFEKLHKEENECKT
jgi:hypothetical protein